MVYTRCDWLFGLFVVITERMPSQPAANQTDIGRTCCVFTCAASRITVLHIGIEHLCNFADMRRIHVGYMNRIAFIQANTHGFIEFAST